MHLAGGAITPECAVLTYGAAAAGLGACVLRSITQRTSLSSQKLQLAAALGCTVFAAQAINVPIAPGFSGHLVGGVLLAWALGPALGAWTMAIVLAAQALMLGDGGIAALGANVINMALVPAALVAMARRFSTASASGMAFAAALSVVLAAGLVVGETALFRPTAELTGWTEFAARMIGYHLWIGALEGAATAAVIGLAIAAARQRPAAPRLAIGLAAAAVVAALILPVSSSLPDGYEAAAEHSGMVWLLGR
jgi:cobalt/nickel transport system permease protein